MNNLEKSDLNNVKYMTLQQIDLDPNFPFTLGMMRHHLANRHKNGLEKAVRKIGKRIFIRRDLFIQWIEEQATKD